MMSTLRSVPLIGLLAISVSSGQSIQRWAVMPAQGAAAKANAVFAYVENRVADELTAQLTGVPGLTLIDRASIDKVLKEQNFQNGDRSSPETATRIGKLLGVNEIVLLQVFDFSYTAHNEDEGKTTRNIATVVLRANAKMIDVETGVIRAQPASAFQDSVVVSETTKSGGFQLGTIRTPPKQKTTGGDPKVIADNEGTKAVDAVVKELASKLTSAAPAAAAGSTDLPMVAGIVNGAVYINQGAGAGIKVGDRFQIVREAPLGINDPKTGKPMMQKQEVCVLTIEKADDSNSSGSCKGGLPQTKDMAQPLKQ